MELEKNLLSGLRLTHGGIHLGHYLGCLTPLDKIKTEQSLFFVIRDRGTIVEKSSYDFEKNLIQILIDLNSTVYADRIKFILQSKLQTYFSPIYDYIQDIVSLNQLKNVHPQRGRIKNNTTNLSVKDFLFPIESACTFFILNADTILMNDDNLATIKFANKISKKISNKINNQIFPLPQLVHGSIPRLLGHDYHKACKANNNVIFLSDNQEQIDSKLDKLLNFKYLFKNEPDLASQRTKLRGDFIIPDKFLPFQYLLLFSEDEKVKENIENLKMYKNFDELSVYFRNEMHHFFYKISDKRNDVINKPDKLIDKLYSDTTEAEKIAKKVLENFLSMKL